MNNFSSTDRILRDLAALKTPCSAPFCNVDSPHSSTSIMKELCQPLGIQKQETYSAMLALSKLLKFYAMSSSVLYLIHIF